MTITDNQGWITDTCWHKVYKHYLQFYKVPDFLETDLYLISDFLLEHSFNPYYDNTYLGLELLYNDLKLLCDTLIENGEDINNITVGCLHYFDDKTITFETSMKMTAYLNKINDALNKTKWTHWFDRYDDIDDNGKIN